jgi:uncharacterized protein (DUF1501 family)
MKRRQLLKNALLASAGAALGPGLALPRSVYGLDCSLPDMPRTLVNLMFYGGMDSRFIFMPAPDHDVVISSAGYLDKLWAARQVIYDLAYPDYASMFAAEYDAVVDPFTGDSFGIHKSCGWLRSQFESGRAAVIANSFCSLNRRHDQSQLNANAGDPGFDDLIYDRDGWGGRLAGALSATANTVELSHEISVFGNGTTPGQRLQRVIHAKNTRDIALPDVNPDWAVTDRRNVLARALKSYYEGRSQESSDTPFSTFFQHNEAFREFGATVKSRRDACGPLPDELAGLDLISNHFEQQCRNLFDICLVPDVLNVRSVSMRYDGWDTHNNQHGRVSGNLSDVFGADGGLATAMGQIGLLDGPSGNAADQLLFCITSDFGRQLRANLDRGTDHGRGLYTLLIGSQLAGGVYGEMFPEREALEDANGKIPLETSGADILGQTSTERVFAEACEWMQPGTASAVFPNAGSSALEPGVSLDGLFTA